MQRLTSGSLNEVLDKVGPAIAAGAVNIISVEAIRARSGDRWNRKREQVEAFVERTFGKLSEAGGMIIALNDAEFLTVQPSASRTAALGVSANVLKEALEFFLGAAAREDLRLFQVTGFEDGELTVQPIEPSQAFAETPEPAGPGAPAAPPADEFAIGRPKRVCLVGPSGTGVDVSIGVEPTWNVGGRVIASYVLRAEVSMEGAHETPRPVRQGELSPNLAGEIAIETLQYAVELIEGRNLGVAFHVPLSLSALTYSTSRYRLLHALRDLSADTHRFIVLEVTDLSDGFPQSRMAELVSTLSPYARAVLARAPSETADVSAWRRSGLSGVTLDCSHLDPADRNVQFRLARFVGGALEVSKACVGYRFKSRSLMLAAWSAGFSHLNGPAIAGNGLVQGPVRLQPSDLFAGDRQGAA